ncbi:hypothetical protein PG994_004693 [Apiospora phragmitis]|uniref:F-box domain-containing protein n=1 Tax=Apiospora phragmitis TaxID=2905665 RepID=A0ABR1VRB2_9PEZI
MAKFDDLPLEMVLAICEHLSLYQRVRLGLSCGFLYNCMRKDKVWERVLCNTDDEPGKGTVYRANTDDEDRWKFLEELEVTLPDHELCYYCRIFHRRTLPKTQTLWRPLPGKKATGTECDAKEVTFPRWASKIGVSGSATFTPLCETIETYKKLHNASRSVFKCFHSYTKLDTEAVIANGCLLVHRVQRLWVPVHLSGSDVLVRYGLGSIAGDFKICSHHNPYTDEMIANFIGPVRRGYCYALAASSVPGTTRSLLPRQIKRCEDCPTEYEFTHHIHEDDSSVELVLDVWQNFGKCLKPKTPGWLNCWGRLNPRFQSSGNDEYRAGWANSDIAYVANETLFPTLAGASAASHASAARAREHWKALKESSAALSQGRVGAPVVPHLPRHELEALKESILKSRGQSTLRMAPFPSSFISSSGNVAVAYTRTPGVVRQDTLHQQLPVQQLPVQQLPVQQLPVQQLPVIQG